MATDDATDESSSVEHTTPEWTGEATGRRLSLATGIFVVTTAGFVFTLFFATQFVGTGTGGFTGGLVGGSGASTGFGISVLLSPLVALVVGWHVGRDGEPRAVVDAALGSTVGFVVMFLAGLVLSASLSGAGAGTGGFGVGGLVGFALGVGLTGAGAAAVARSGDSVLSSVTGHPLRGAAVTGVGTFLTFGVGYAAAVYLAGELASEGAGIGFGSMGGGSVAFALGFGLLALPLVAVLVGRHVAADGDGPAGVAAAGGVAAGLGAVAFVLLLYAVLLVVQPEGASTESFPLGPLVGFAVGTGLTGAGSGYVAARE